MSFTPWKLISVCGLFGIGIAAAGCGTASADQQARDDMSKARTEAARSDDGAVQAIQLLQTAAGATDTSDTVSAQAKAALGQAQYDAAIEALRTVDRNQVQAARLTLDIAALARQLSIGGALISGYKKGDPKSAHDAILQQIAAAQGGPDKAVWINSDKAQIASLAAVTQNISKLEGEISQKQAQVKQLDDQRAGLLTQADQLAKASDNQKGQESVDSYKKASDLRKQAADLATRAETVKTQIIPLEQDLMLAQGQQAIITNAVAQLQQQVKLLDEHWKAVQQQIIAQQELAKQIDSGAGGATTQADGQMDSSAGKSISEKAAALAALLTETNKLRDDAVNNLTAASSSFEQAFNAAQNVRTRIETLRQNDWVKNNSEPAFRAELDAVNPMYYKLRRAGAEAALGQAMTQYAAELAARLNVRELLVPAAAATGVTPPAEVVDANIEKQQKEALERAESAYSTAESLLEDIIGSGRQSTEQERQTVRAANIALIFARWGHMQAARLAGATEKVRDLDQRALEAVNQAKTVDGIVFPWLPSANLRAAARPTPAPTEGTAPTTEPTTAPSGAGG